MLHGIALTLIDWFNVLELNLTWFFYKNSLDYKRNNSLEILSLGNTLATCNKLIIVTICFQNAFRRVQTILKELLGNYLQYIYRLNIQKN